MARGLRSDRARVYLQLRSAHLERARALPAAALVFHGTRYDFDPSLAEGLELHEAGRVRAAILLARSRVNAIEINEPLMLQGLPTSTLLLVALGILPRRNRPRPAIVTYAIENLDPFARPIGPRLRSRIRRALEVRMFRFVCSRVDRIVFGTPAAERIYGSVTAGLAMRAASTLIPALPAPAAGAALNPKTPMSVVFLGALGERKGFPLVMTAWPAVVAALPEATITVIGKGTWADRAADWAAHDPSVTLVIDPPRARIADILDAGRVLTLPSQSSSTWREQIGLPIVEGLERGCLVVTTAETGLADWLATAGHSVIPSDADAPALAAALIEQLRSTRTPGDVVASLPPVDGRLAADEWLFDLSSRRAVA